MTLSLRIDVDVPFGYHSRWRRLLNRLKIDYGLVPGLEKIGYLGPTLDLMKYLNEKQIPATWFFGSFSRPNKKRVNQLALDGHEVAFHSERTASLPDFKSELQEYQKSIGIKVRGFSKHGSGEMKLSKKHHVEYDSEQFLKYAQHTNMEYFIGNGMNYQDSWEIREGVCFIPSVFWIDRLSQYQDENVLEHVMEYSRSKPVVILIHPVWWKLRTDLRNHLGILADNSKFHSLKFAIDSVFKT